MSISPTILNMIHTTLIFCAKKTLKKFLFSVSTAHSPDSNPYATPSRPSIEYHSKNHLSSNFFKTQKRACLQLSQGIFIKISAYGQICKT